MRDMTSEEYQDFMMGYHARTGKLASVRSDGRPHVAPIWFALDGDDLIFTTWHESVKAANLKHDARVSLCVDDEKPPFAFVIIEGIAEFDEHPDPNEMLKWTTLISGRYMGDDLADQYGKRNAVEGEWLIRIKPSKVLAKTGISD